MKKDLLNSLKYSILITLLLVAFYYIGIPTLNYLRSIIPIYIKVIFLVWFVVFILTFLHFATNKPYDNNDDLLF
jgi:hypothetical protein